MKQYKLEVHLGSGDTIEIKAFTRAKRFRIFPYWKYMFSRGTTTDYYIHTWQSNEQLAASFEIPYEKTVFELYDHCPPSLKSEIIDNYLADKNEL